MYFVSNEVSYQTALVAKKNCNLFKIVSVMKTVNTFLKKLFVQL